MEAHDREHSTSMRASSISGEIFYRSKSLSESSLRLDSKLRELDEFLGADNSSQSQRSLSKQTFKNLRNIRKVDSTIYNLSNNHDSCVMHQLLDSSCDRVQKEVHRSGERLAEEIRNLAGTIDAQLMGRTLEYLSMCKQEMGCIREKLNENSIECNRRKHEAKRLRDLHIFSKHLEIETQGCVSFSAVALDSSQWERCGKAVQENVSSPRMLSAGHSHVTVLNAFKIEHKLLSRHMQRAARSSRENAKVKGLFVSLSKTEIFGFCAYGLHCQDVLCTSSSNSSCASREDILPGLFLLPWFCAELSGSAEPIRVVDKSTSRDRVKSDGAYVTHQREKVDGSKPQGTAEILCRLNTNLKLRFSKYSTPYGGKGEDDISTRDTDEGGAYILLCRVLLNKVQTVERDFSPEDIKSALSSGFDAVYCRSREEYVLLNPDFVLPEFLMHVNYTSDHFTSKQGVESIGLRSQCDPPSRAKSPSNASSKKNSFSKITLPSLLTMADGYCDGTHEKGYSGEEIGRPVNTAAEKSSEFKGFDSFGKLLMSNKIAKHVRENASSYVSNQSEEAVSSKISHIHLQSEPDDDRQRHQLLSTNMIQRKQQIVNYVRSVPENFNADRKAALRSAISSLSGP